VEAPSPAIRIHPHAEEAVAPLGFAIGAVIAIIRG
jgi:hypothetical protein